MHCSEVMSLRHLRPQLTSEVGCDILCILRILTHIRLCNVYMYTWHTCMRTKHSDSSGRSLIIDEGHWQMLAFSIPPKAKSSKWFRTALLLFHLKGLLSLKVIMRCYFWSWLQSERRIFPSLSLTHSFSVVKLPILYTRSKSWPGLPAWSSSLFPL